MPSSPLSLSWLMRGAVTDIFYRLTPMERRCGAQTQNGNSCRKIPVGTDEFCWQHTGPQCSMCLGYMRNSVRQLPCNHSFHTRCIDHWKDTCTGDPTCPMCRAPFDVPIYRCRLIIERVSDGSITTTEFDSSNVRSIVSGFGIDLRTLETGGDMLRSEIHWQIEPGEDLLTVLEQIGLPRPDR
jgi:Ring finger domain